MQRQDAVFVQDDGLRLPQQLAVSEEPALERLAATS